MEAVIILVVTLVICAVLLITDDGRTDKEVVRDLKRNQRRWKL